MPTTNLTPKQEAFAVHYALNLNASAAYIHAYNVGAGTKRAAIDSTASTLLKHPKISKRIKELSNAASAPVAYTIERALSEWIGIAEANPDELIGLRIGCCRFCWGEDFKYQWKEREYLAEVEKAELDAAPLPDIAGGFGFRKGRLPNPDCPECEGEGVERVVPRDTSKLSPDARRLYGGIKRTRLGPEVIIADRMKARENACRIIGAFKDGIRLDGSIATMAQVVQMQASDPNEASRLYREMIAGPLRAK